jgi:hypothetical protein
MPQRPEGEFGRKCDWTIVHKEDRSRQMSSSVTWLVKSLNRDLKNFGCGLAKQSTSHPIPNVAAATQTIVGASLLAMTESQAT